MNKLLNNSKKMLLINYIVVVVATLFDQWTKKMIEPLKTGDDIDVMPGVFSFSYVENRGAAFGIMNGQRIFFLIIAIVVFVAITYVFLRIPAEKKYYKLDITLAFILAGAIGNMIDRFSLGYVRDFINFYCINFAVFNVADIYITCGTPFVCLLILFVYKEDDLNFLKRDNSGV